MLAYILSDAIAVYSDEACVNTVYTWCSFAAAAACLGIHSAVLQITWLF